MSQLPPQPPLADGNVRDRIALWFDVSDSTRLDALRAMTLSQAHFTSVYWVHLLLAMAIATLGLVLGSTAVIIGAMLVAPLMGPIVAIGMGITIGSASLSFRAILRVALSISAVVLGSALIALWVPLRDANAEIIARTSPNVLDLLIAIACALAAAYSAARNVSDVGSTAAGTSIGISLVPPLCVVGYGLGTRQWEIARGAALLFTANFSAIVLFSTMTFFLFGFDRAHIEQDEVALKSSRHSFVFRLLLPALLTGVVFVPLRRALQQVVAQVQTRQRVRAIVESSTRQYNLVRSSVNVVPGNVRVRLVLIGSVSAGVDLESSLRAQLSNANIGRVDVQVTALADASHVEDADTEPEIETSAQMWSALQPRIERSLRSLWADAEVGELLEWSLTSHDAQRGKLVLYVGEQSLGSVGERFLERSLSQDTGISLVVLSVSLPTRSRVLESGGGTAWLHALIATQAAIAPTQLYLCIGVPPIKTTPTIPSQDSGVAPSDGGTDARVESVDDLDATIANLHEQIRLFSYDSWSSRVVALSSVEAYYRVQRTRCDASQGDSPAQD